ncbi:uncharacterized protein LOC123560415 [Mercenaria mercenaria]|uniref:uncharacterized protein LOC123560415 n=1 Tax=Mercenaria mercenaria TaxID=6596 RepID=UPI00234E8C9E|nr:uncharacterized protein LOC123560415 [Mercenaria mercenaria]
MQSGYAYVKKIYVQENYQPPFQMTDERFATWMIPGSLSTGAKVEVTLEGLNRGFHIHLVSSEEMRDYANRKGIEEIVRRSRHSIRILYAPNKQYFTEYVDGVKVNEEASRQIFTEERDDHIYKVLIQIDQADILKIYLRGEHVMTYSREGLDLTMLRQVVVDAPHGPYKPPVAIHRIEFTK